MAAQDAVGNGELDAPAVDLDDVGGAGAAILGRGLGPLPHGGRIGQGGQNIVLNPPGGHAQQAIGIGPG